jgi:SAM-dependent methyltransferase
MMGSEDWASMPAGESMNEPSAAHRWDERYNTAEYVFGTAPNDFLASVVDRLPPGKALSLGDGEGRNGVFLAERGYDVTAVDASAVGLEKARRLAAQRGRGLTTKVCDLEDYLVEPGQWDVIVSIFVHMPADLRRRIHCAAMLGLRPGGAFVLEAYAREQADLRTGGPPLELLMGVDELRRELNGLEFEIAREVTREIHEGTRHNGIGSVVQLLGFRRPT